MHLLISGHVNGSVDYIGPFPSLLSAQTYAHDHPELKKTRWHIQPLVIPQNIVAHVVWRV